MRIEEIDHHAVAVDLLKKGPILDVGCRGFRFAKWFSDGDHKVTALDPSPDLSLPLMYTDIHFLKVALVAPSWPSPHLKDEHRCIGLEMYGDPEGWHTHAGAPHSVDGAIVPARTMEDFPGPWDVVKLNVEGAEYDILREWPGSEVARQISVSFHEHTPQRIGREGCDKIVDDLRKWYTPARHVWEKRYHAGENYWTTLLIRSDLV